MRTNVYLFIFCLLLIPHFSYSQIARLPIQVNPDGENVIELKANGFAKFSPDGKYIAVNGDNGVDLWDLQTGELYRSFQITETNRNGTRNVIAFDADFSHDMAKIVIGSVFRLYVWDIVNSELIIDFDAHPTSFGLSAHSQVPNFIKDVVVSPNGNYALTRDHANVGKLWDINNYELTSERDFLFSYRGGGGQDISTNNKYFVISNNLKFLNDLNKVSEFDGGFESQFIPNSELIVVITTPNYFESNRKYFIKIVDIISGKLINEVYVKQIKFNNSNIDISFDGRFLIDGAYTYLFDLKMDKVVHEFEDAFDDFRGISSFHPNGKMFLISGPNPSSVYIYNVDDFVQTSNVELFEEYE